MRTILNLNIYRSMTSVLINSWKLFLICNLKLRLILTWPWFHIFWGGSIIINNLLMFILKELILIIRYHSWASIISCLLYMLLMFFFIRILLISGCKVVIWNLLLNLKRCTILLVRSFRYNFRSKSWNMRFNFNLIATFIIRHRIIKHLLVARIWEVSIII